MTDKLWLDPPRSRRRMPWRRLTTLVAVCAALFTCAVALPAAASTPGIHIPADESPHNTKNEWWYFTGHLAGHDPSGKLHAYGYELVFFRQGISYPDQAVYAGNLAITDLTNNAFKWESRVSVQPDNLPAGGGYNITVQDWAMAGKNGSSTLSGGFTDQSYQLKLSVSQSKPAALHGNLNGVKGLIPYAQWGQSYYYSFTDLKATGTVYDHGVPVQVTGTSWFDHQYGNFATAYGSWNWFSIQLLDGTQYMIYQIKDSTGTIVEKAGTKVNADGTTVDLDGNSLSVQALGSWTSPATGLTYSSGWRLNVPGGQFTIIPQRKDQEVAWPDAPGGAYWEGTSSVVGSVGGNPVAGQGYTEITTPGITF
jgi:predicted secreted hydrolase